MRSGQSQFYGWMDWYRVSKWEMNEWNGPKNPFVNPKEAKVLMVQSEVTNHSCSATSFQRERSEVKVKKTTSGPGRWMTDFCTAPVLVFVQYTG